MFRIPFLRLAAPLALFAASTLLLGCGGGGSVSGVGAVAETSKLTVAADRVTLNAGQSIGVAARATFRGGAPTGMKWQIVNLTATPTARNNAVPAFVDANCGAMSAQAPLFLDPGSMGSGLCATTLNVPLDAPAGTWRITGIATGPGGATVSDSIDIAVSPANAGFSLEMVNPFPQGVEVNQMVTISAPYVVTLAGVNSVTDVQYAWTEGASNPAKVTILAPNWATAGVQLPTSGLYTFNVKATARLNGQPVSATAVVSLNAQNHDVVSAGTAQIVAPTTAVQLVGNVGKPDTNATYSYSWAQTTDPSLPAVVLSNSDTPTASFVTPKIPGLYTFRFTVTKTVGLQVSTMTADTAVTVKADPVTLFSVSAGDAKTAALNSTVALNGAVDVQTGGATSTATYAYKWTQVSGPTVVLANTNAKTASFVPTVAGTYVFSLDVSATSTGGTITANGLTQVVVLPAASPANPTTANVAMSVNAGAIQTALPNAIVTLTGTKTVQGTDTGVTYAYQWVQTDVATAPATVAITNASSTNASIRVALPGIYYFQFVVNATLPDGSVRTSSAMTSVVVGAASKGLTATAGNAQSGNVSKPVILTGAVSTQGDYSNALFAYKWTQISGSTLSLSNSNNAVASFVPILPGVYSFRFDVTVTDNGKTSTTSTTTQVLVLL